MAEPSFSPGVGSPSDQTQTSRASPATPAQQSPFTATLLDVQSLDDYLLHLVLSKLDTNTITSSTAVSSKDSWRWPALKILTLWFTAGNTPAVRLLGLQVDTTTTSTAASASSASFNSHSNQDATQHQRRLRLVRYAVLSILVPYMYYKLKAWVASTATAIAAEESVADNSLLSLSQTQQQQQHVVSRQRKHAVAAMLIRVVDACHAPVQLVLLLACWSGILTDTPPNIAAVLSSWKYQRATTNETTAESTTTTAVATPRLHVDFAHRRWLYDCLLQTSRIWWAGLHLVPTVWQTDLQDHVTAPARRAVCMLRRRIRMLPAVDAVVGNKNQQQAAGVNVEHCPICRRTEPSTIPVQGNCACRQVYCYACLYSKAVRLKRVYCLSCGDGITSSRFL